MTETHLDDWSPFKVGEPPGHPSWFRLTCQTLATVTHVTHLRSAVDVLRAGQLTPQLVFDKSRLNTERILVLWLSPNDWSGAGGFRYGNVGFELDWPSLVQGKKFYWVGVMGYSPSACRILITDNDRGRELKEYDPTARDGPWWFDEKSGNHYWNGKFCVEFMLENEIKLSDVNKLKFVKHHKYQCSIDPAKCPNKNYEAAPASALFLAGVCNHRFLSKHPELWLNRDKYPNEVLISSWNNLKTLGKSKQISWGGPVKSGSQDAIALARALLGTYFERDKAEGHSLLSLFQDRQAAIDAVASVIEADLELPQATLLREEASD